MAAMYWRRFVASRLLQPVERDAADAEAIEGTDFAVASAVADEHGVADEMDGGVVVEAVGVALDEFALRPGFAAVGGDGGDEGIALLWWERKYARVVVEDGEEVAAAGQALDAGGAVGGFQLGGFGRGEGLARIAGAEAVLRALIGAGPGEKAAIGEFDDAGLLQAAAAAHGHGPPTRGFGPGGAFIIGIEPGGDGACVPGFASVRISAA